MGSEKLQARQEKTKEKFEEKARKKKEEETGAVEEKKEAKPKPKKKVEIKKPVVSEAKGRAEYLPISSKTSIEVARAIRGMPVEKADTFLERVMKLETPVRYYRFNKKIPHRKGKGFGTGQYPIKVAKFIKELLRNAVSNAKYLNLDAEKLYIKSAIANRAISREKQGRYTHLEIVVAEKEEKPKVKK